MLKKRIYKILAFLLILIMMLNITIGLENTGHKFLLSNGEAEAATTMYCYDRYSVKVVNYWDRFIGWDILAHSSNPDPVYNMYGYDSINVDFTTGKITGNNYGYKSLRLDQTIYTIDGNNAYSWYSWGAHYPDYIPNSVGRTFFVIEPLSEPYESNGSLITSNIIAPDGTYPDNGKHTDGYWYIKKAVNQAPAVSITSPIDNQTLTEVEKNFIPFITVSDPDGDTLTCKYSIDSVERETKTISNTATPQLVSFNALDISNLSESRHTLKFEVSDGRPDPVSSTVDIIVDKLPPVIGNVNYAADDTCITVSGTATDSISDAGSLEYRYTVGSNIIGWIIDAQRKIDSLQPNTEYNTKFEVKDKVGHIAAKEQNVYTKAQVPQVAISNIKENSLDLTISDLNPAVTQYQVVAGTSFVSASGTLIASPQWITLTNKKITVSGLSPNKAYEFKIKAKNQEGIETAYSTPMTGTTLSQAPENITLDKGINFIKINWNAIVGATGYDIEADGKVNGIGPVTSYTHEGLQPETSHDYRVRVKNAGGTGPWSNLLSGTTLPNPPETPMITDTHATQTEITISWDAVAKATGYEIEADGKVVSTNLDMVYTDIDLQPDSLHKYRVRAKNAGGESTWSAFSEIRTLPNPPEVPQNLNGAPTRYNITLTWNEAARAEGYEIELDGSIKKVDKVTSYVHEGLSVNTVYTYRIRARNRGGISEWSNPQKVTTWPEIPPAPTNIMATAERETITLTWYNSPFAESYDLLIDGTTTVNVTETSYTHTGLTPGSKHTYKIRSKNISGNGMWSNPVEISSLPKTDTPTQEAEALTNIAAVVTNKSVTIAWQAAAVNAQYEIEVDGKVLDNGKETVYNHTGLEPVSFHTYRVRNRDVNGNGQWCAVLALSTLPNPPDAPVNVKAAATNTQIELRWDRQDGASYDVEVDGKVIDAGEASSYIDNNLKPGTIHTYRVRGKNITGVTAWSDSITKSTTSPSYEVECTKGLEFNFSLLASNVQDFAGMAFVVTYNPEEIEVLDLFEFTADRETTSGKIPGTNVTVKHTSGRIEFTVSESVTPGTIWFGEIATIVFKAKMDGKANINFSIE